MFLIIDYGITVAYFNFSELFSMTVIVTDPDFNFFELDWKSFRYKTVYMFRPSTTP